MPRCQQTDAARGCGPLSTLDALRRQLLDAREARAAVCARLVAAVPAGHALVFLSLNVPGPEKNSPRLDQLFAGVRERLTSASGSSEFHLGPVQEEGGDPLGPWLAVCSPGEATDVKRRCLALEEKLPAGRLIDLDVYARSGDQIGRTSLGLPRRRCLVCDEPAADCMRTQRHGGDEIADAVSRLLRADDMTRLAGALVEGARVELALTPKPGLVDRRDNGSHPDLSFELMERSIALLPEYYGELLRLLNPAEAGFHEDRHAANPAEAGFHEDRHAANRAQAGFHEDRHAANRAQAGFHDSSLQACVEAGRRAEARMVRAIGTNAHRGYIFLSGLVLLAGASRAGIADVADAIVAARRAPDASHGEAARRRHGVGGVLGEALAGLPSVFEHALPALESAEARFGPTDAARHAAMATLMTVVEDTTALHRCGADGLARVQRDGRRILAAIEGGGNYVELLERLNEEYRAAGMTMGGVADLLAISMAVQRHARASRPSPLVARR